MKNYKIRVSDEKSAFLEELMKHLDFVEFEEVEAFIEPRVYPGANFEIRSGKSGTSGTTVKPMSKAVEMDLSSSPEDQMKRLREVMLNIDKMRDQNRRK